MPRAAAHLKLVPPDLEQPSTGPTLQWERFTTLARELPPLFLRHWEEVGTHKDVVTADPQWELLFNLDLAGALLCTTMRSQERTLVGYAFVQLAMHPNHQTILAAQYNRFWLDPAYREGLAGMKLLRKAEELLDNLNVPPKLRYASVPCATPRMAKLFERMGYKPFELTLHKFVE